MSRTEEKEQRPWIVSKSCWDVQKWMSLAHLCQLWASVPWNRCSVPCYVSKDCCQFASTGSMMGSLSFFPFWKQLSTWNAIWGYTFLETSKQLVFGGSIIQVAFIWVLFKLECVHQSPLGTTLKCRLWVWGEAWDSTALPHPQAGRTGGVARVVCWALKGHWIIQSPDQNVPQISWTEPPERESLKSSLLKLVFMYVFLWGNMRRRKRGRERKKIIRSPILYILIPYSMPGILGTGNMKYNGKLSREVVYFGKQTLKAFSTTPLFLSANFTPRDPIRIQPFSISQQNIICHCSLCSKILLAIMLLFLCVSRAESPKMWPNFQIACPSGELLLVKPAIVYDSTL